MMDEYSPKAPYGKITKKHSLPKKLNLSGNFTCQHKQFEVIPVCRTNMRQNILDAVARKTEKMISDDRNTLYEDPTDVIVTEKPPSKPPRKRTIQGIAVSSPRTGKEHKSLLKEQKRKLTKKYESLITTLMDRCEENIVVITEKDNHITKLKDKLKTVLEYNKLFADENDQLRSQYQIIVKYVDECKIVIKQQREIIRELEQKKVELEERVKKFEVPDRDHSQSAIPLVEVCMSCSSRQIVLNQAREHNTRLQKDMQALKDVLYRLNVQLSRYQEKLQASKTSENNDVYKPSERYDTLDSLITASIGCRTEKATEEQATKSHHEETRLVDMTGLLSAQALAPLFDAYQENLQEKDNLILDYEKQFEIMNKKSKEIVLENKSLSERLKSVEEELVRLRQSYKKVVCEKETGDIEKATLVERAERAESKLKEVYELYEDKMSAMMRDYETVHREYYNLKNTLEASASQHAQLHALRATTVPADLHERRLDHCKRLLEELKHQYSMESERKSEQVNKLQEQLKLVQEKYDVLDKDNQTIKHELEAALKNVRLYRKAAVIFRQRLKAATARLRARSNKHKHQQTPLRHALHALDNIKHEIKTVKARAYSSLEELERRIVEQERRAMAAHHEYSRELDRARLALARKEEIIRSLIDKVADVEEVRLSQTNSHRLQGIVDTPEHSPREEGTHVKLATSEGGFYADKDSKRKPKSYTEINLNP